MKEDKSLTIATANDQTVFVFHPHRSDGVRLQGKTINTLTAFMGTGGNNMPMVAMPIHDKATRSTGKRKLHNGEYSMDGAGNGLGIGNEGDPMNTLTSGDRHAVAYDELNNSISDIHHTLRAGTKQSTGVLTSVVRRLTPLECERLQGFPDNWTESQPLTQRYKQMGNAVTVNVAEWVFGRISATLTD